MTQFHPRGRARCPSAPSDQPIQRFPLWSMCLDRIQLTRRLRTTLVVMLFFSASAGNLFGFTKSGTAYTTDGTQADVAAAIANASPGDTVSVPSGSFEWGANASFVSVNKAITLTGAGTSLTTISIAPTAGSYGSATIRVSGVAVVKGFSIRQPGGGPTTAISAGGPNGWRITDIVYHSISSGQVGYFVYAGSYGLIDNCIINGGSGNDEWIFTRGPADSWQTPATLGTADAVYVEDCVFNNFGYPDFNSNARAVVRFCTVNGPIKIDGHGLASNTPARGVRHTEIYRNTWTLASSFWAAIELRGGSGMIFDNVAAAPANGAWLLLREYGAVNRWPNFGNEYQTPFDYPVKDQIGVGMDPKAGGSEPVYLWNNRRSGVPWTLIWGSPPPTGAIERYRNQTGDPAATFTMQDIIKSDRDYFMENSTFDGSSGVGRGTKSQMQAVHPTKVGVGFWVTDEGEWNSKQAGPDGQLYVWSGNSWTLKYTPYIYPHPRRGPSVPQGVQVRQ